MTSSSPDPGAMDLESIRQAIDSGDTRQRMRAITAMQPHEPADCVPLLVRCLDDDAFVVRSLACMGLGYKRSPEGLAALMAVLDSEGDHNVRAEAANAVARHGPEQAAEPLLALYARDEHWLVHTSILAALAAEEDVPEAVLHRLLELAADDANATVKDAAATVRLRLQQLQLEKLLPQEPC